MFVALILNFPRGSVQIVFHCAHRATGIHLYDPPKLACLPSLGMASVLVPLRPSNEHILIVRVPGARDRHECHSTLFIVGALRARRTVCLLPRIILRQRVTRTQQASLSPRAVLSGCKTRLSRATYVQEYEATNEDDDLLGNPT